MFRATAAIGLFAFFGSVASADMITAVTSGTSAGHAVSGAAVFTYDNTLKTLSIQVTNTTALVNDIATVLDGLAFLLVGSPVLTLTGVSVPNHFVDCTGAACAQTASFTDYTLHPPAVVGSPYSWALVGNILIAGAADGGTPYHPGGIVNNTITSASGLPSAPHNDYLLGPAIFDFTYTGNIAGLDATVFLWGTVPNRTEGDSTPEPSAILLFGAVLALTSRRLLRKRLA